MYLPDGHLLQNGKYKLGNVVGQGGFGITYQGIWFTEVKGSLGKLKTEVPICVKEYFFKDYCLRDTDTFAVKVHSETGQILFRKFKEKLISEARILSEVHHPYIVNVLEVFEENNTAYIVMEYIAGSSLKERLEKQSPLSENRVLKYIRQIGEALQFVHEKNILHLDIKPSNILIDANDRARLIDFGVSKRYDIEQQETSTTMLTLSKGFASIEQYDDEGTLSFSPCPDIYSLGATMYNLLTGKIPTESILRATKELVEPRAINPSVSEKTNAAILKAMQVVPAERFQTIAAMLDALDMPMPEAEEEASSGTTSAEEGDETMVLSPSATSSSRGDDADMTIVNRPDTLPVRSHGRRKRVLVLSMIGIVAVLASASYLYIQNGKTTKITNPQTILQTTADSASVDRTDVETLAEIPTQSPQQEPVRQTPDVQRNASQTSAEREETPVSQVPVTVSESLNTIPTAVDKDSAYHSLLAVGNQKMNDLDYAGAKNAFQAAGEIKPSGEIYQLIFAADEHLKEQQVRQKKALYEEKMPLGIGTYVIVRKKATGKYGAIDRDGNEQIPCKYLNVGRAEKGRAFFREDNLYDIYDDNAQLITGGVANY